MKKDEPLPVRTSPETLIKDKMISCFGVDLRTFMSEQEIQTLLRSLLAECKRQRRAL